MAQRDTIPQRLKKTTQRYLQYNIVLSKDENGDFQPITYQDFYTMVKTLGTAFLEKGLTRGQHIGIIADNRKEWLLTDLAALAVGLVDVPRGSDSTADEIGYILAHAECPLAFAENAAQANKIFSKIADLPGLKEVVLFDPAPAGELKVPEGLTLSTLDDLMNLGKKALEKMADRFEEELEKGEGDELASLLYTSGTTGTPKGVMLTHHSFGFQIDRIQEHVALMPGQVLLSVLPIWHSFERAVTYICVGIGLTLAYSKPVGAVLIPDMAKVRPHWLTSVPRIWEGVRAAIFRKMEKSSKAVHRIFTLSVLVGETHAYFLNMLTGRIPHFHKRNVILDTAISILPVILLYPFRGLANLLVFKKIRKTLGGRFIAGISGGGALPDYVDHFFQAAGILLLEGYGLTETAPVLAVRKQKHPVTGTVGPLLKDIEHRVLNAEGAVLPPGKKGVLYVKSEQIMQGYYKQPEETEKVLKEGWLNTGDIAVFTTTGEIKILGRDKDTIVLMGGENIEPGPIEDKLCESPYIDQVMVVGQDKKFLGALIVPNMELVEQYAQEQNIPYVDRAALTENPTIQELYHDEIQKKISAQNGFKPFERIFRFALLSAPFEVGEELTHTLKIRRAVVDKKHKKIIASLFV